MNKDNENKVLVSPVRVVLSVAATSLVFGYALQFTPMFNKEKTEASNEGQVLSFKTDDGKTTFRAGEDFPPGRYNVTTEADKAIIFVRSAEGEKLSSEVIGAEDEVINSYPVTFDEGMAIKFMNADEFMLTSVFTDSSEVLSAGLYEVGADLKLSEGQYKVTFASPGSLFVTSENGSKQGVDSTSSNEEGVDYSYVDIKYNDKIHVAITDEVILELVENNEN